MVLPSIQQYLKDINDMGQSSELENMTDKEKLKFIRWTKYFFVDNEGCLYHNQRGETDKPQLVVEQDK